MLTRARLHSSWYLAGCLVLLLGLGGGAMAASLGIPSITGQAKIASNRIEVLPVPDFGAAGPVILQVPGFGEVFVSQCIAGGPLAGFRNTFGAAIEAPGVIFQHLATATVDEDNVIQPGEEGGVSVAYGPGGNLTFQLGSGAGRHRKVATVTVSGLWDPAQNVCRFNAQATVHGS